MLVNEAEGAAEEIDAGGDERRPNAVVVEHERLDEVIGVTLVIRRVDDAVRPHRVHDVMKVFVLALDLAEDRIQRMLKRAVELVPLRGAQLVEVRMHLLARVLENVLAREDGLGNVVQHVSRFGL